MQKERSSVTVSNKTIKAKFAGVKRSMLSRNEKFEKLRGTITELTKEVNSVKREQQQIRKVCVDLVGQLHETRKEQTELKQYGRRNNLKIKGVPHLPDESLGALVTQIGEFLKMEIRIHNLDAIHWVQSKNKTKPNIDIKLFVRSLRDEVFRVARK